MENSKAYSSFIEQISAFGRQKMEGYYPLTLERIYDWERDEIEDIIWETFNQRNDTALATFLPKLKKYNGLKALEDKLAKALYRVMIV